jgi:hypothetical protein
MLAWAKKGMGQANPDRSSRLLPHLGAAYNLARRLVRDTSYSFWRGTVRCELEEKSCKQIADVMSMPIGTGMSGLPRGCAQLRERLLWVRGQEEQCDLRN